MANLRILQESVFVVDAPPGPVMNTVWVKLPLGDEGTLVPGPAQTQEGLVGHPTDDQVCEVAKEVLVGHPAKEGKSPGRGGVKDPSKSQTEGQALIWHKHIPGVQNIYSDCYICTDKMF